MISVLSCPVLYSVEREEGNVQLTRNHVWLASQQPGRRDDDTRRHDDNDDGFENVGWPGIWCLCLYMSCLQFIPSSRYAST